MGYKFKTLQYQTATRLTADSMGLCRSCPTHKFVTFGAATYIKPAIN